MSIIRGTTPTHIFTLPIDTSLLSAVRVTYAQERQVVLNKSIEDCVLDGKTISVRLTQEDTLSFSAGTFVEVQVRVLTLDGEALSSNIMRVALNDVLYDEVLA